MSQPQRMDDKRIAVAVTHHEARDLAIDAIRRFGVTPIPLDEPKDLVSVSHFCCGSVCELQSARTAVVKTIQDLRAVDPGHPVLLIVYPGHEHDGVTRSVIDGDMGVRECSGADSERLKRCLVKNIEWLMQYHPVDALLSTMMDGVHSPSGTTLRFLQWSIRSIHSGTTPRIGTGARELGVSTRTLARHIRQDRMPAPIELFGWAKLLAVSHRSDLNKTSLAASARTFKLDASRIYQLRRRLMRKTSRSGVRSDRPVFPFILQAFRERCDGLRLEDS